MTPLTRLAHASAIALGLALSGPQSALAVPDDFSEMVAEKLPAVVGIVSTMPPAPENRAGPQLPPGFGEYFGLPNTAPRQRGPQRAMGSGFILSEDGYVVTNNHVIEGATGIEVMLSDGRQMSAELIGTDPATDIALLKIEDGWDLPETEWGDSEELDIGDWLVAIGNPFGLDGTVTAGILSARSRNINAGPYDDFLQTDAAINRGNSGGPLFNAEGEVVGVNTAIFSPSGGSVGIGFAVPEHVAQRVVGELRETGRVERGFLGVQVQPLTETTAEALGLEAAEGALVADVTAGSPAQQAGLRAGDIITAIDGEAVISPRDLTFAVAALDTGREVPVTVLRDGTETRLSVTISTRPGQRQQAEAPVPAEDNTPRLGVSIMPLDTAAREVLGIPADVQHV